MREFNMVRTSLPRRAGRVLGQTLRSGARSSPECHEDQGQCQDSADDLPSPAGVRLIVIMPVIRTGTCDGFPSGCRVRRLEFRSIRRVVMSVRRIQRILEEIPTADKGAE
jgi:hypothetical protein